MIRDAMLNIKPCIIFNNTGAQSQMYARLIEEIQRFDKRSKETAMGSVNRITSMAKHGFLLSPDRSDTVSQRESNAEYYEVLKVKLRERAWEFRDFANCGHEGLRRQGTDHDPCLNMADVIQIIDLYCDNPRLFRKIVVPVDPLNDSTDHVVNTFTLSSSRCRMEPREVGAADADDRAVEQAWGFLFQLERSEYDVCRSSPLLRSDTSRTAKFWKNLWRNFLYFVYIMAGFSTTLVAVVSCQRCKIKQCNMRRDRYHSRRWNRSEMVRHGTSIPCIRNIQCTRDCWRRQQTEQDSIGSGSDRERDLSLSNENWQV